MKRKSYVNNESGIALVIALVMLLALTVLGISSMMNSTLDVQMSGNERRALESLNLADAGIQRVVHDLLYDFKKESTLSWVANDTLSTLSLADGTALDISLSAPAGNFDCSPAESCIGDQFGDPFAIANIAGSDIGNSVDPYGGPQPLGDDGYYRVLVLRDGGEPDEIYVRSYAEHSTGARKVIQLHMKINTIDVWRNAVFGGRGSASASITGNVYVAGSVHVLGTGATNKYTISGQAGVFNGYARLGIGDYDTDELLNRMTYDVNGDGKYDNIEWTINESGDTVYSLESEFRVKNVQVELSSHAANIGEVDDVVTYANKKWQGQLDGIYSNNPILGDEYYSLNKEEDGSVPVYDLGDKIQMPSFEDEFYAPDGTHYGTYKSYIEDNSLTLPNTVCDLIHTTTGDFLEGDADNDGDCDDDDVAINGTGCMKWASGAGSEADPDTIQVAGRVKFDSACANTEYTIGGAAGHIEYTGKGLLYGSKTLRLWGNIVTPDNASNASGNYIKDHVMGLLTTGNIQISGPGDPNANIMAGMFAAGMVSAENSGSIVGTVVGNEFCLSGTEADGSCKGSGGGQSSDIFYVPKMSEEMKKLGMIMGNQVYSFTTYEWKQVF